MSKRKKCTVCDKALAACICQHITKIDSVIELIILQHPGEVKNAIGTARILNLSLPQCQIIVGENFTDNAQLNDILNDPTRQCFLLYPSEDSIAAENLADKVNRSMENEGLDANINRTFILLDGTWRKAFKMYQSSINLHTLSAVRLNAEQQSQYTIRQTSIEGGLSTVEAGFLLLATLEQDKEKYQPLLTAFEYMINFQIAQMPDGLFNKNYK
ncbi:tRNA-uridine aminocarboxypropyltransferase [Moritella sp. Urea-trap-13]|uniref:tRNA-uridine aminocarboxypropyltransferase n=1 Tax=Moritella sp. Urea-trap-13 TaxID=2058327 RepID=UPI000C32C437|nr:tRNA-uridine aminocarboxypropyltransferase [Moritella sp. Urea-trap-13]PKH06874.1 DTW domain-containing protein [Moritella sp. Urea-trap-13]